MNKNIISTYNKENLAIKNINESNTAAVQEQLQNISTQMAEFNRTISELISDSKTRDERLSQMEQCSKATEAQVGKSEINKSIESNYVFERQDFHNSTAIAPESNKISPNDISLIVQKEIKKLNLDTNKSDSISTDVSRELRNTIRSELHTKDSNMRREYKLTVKTKYEHFMDFLKSELRTQDLLYVIDLSLNTTVDLDQTVKEKHKFGVQDIIINRIDQGYQAKVVEIQEPIELLKHIKEIKRNETNVTSMTLCRQLYSLQYNPSKEKASVFIDRFEDVVRAYNNLTEVEDLPEIEKKDAFYSVVVSVVPQIINIDFMTKSMAGNN